jgi:hypothetical protein
MDIYTQVPDKTTRAALKRLSDLFDGSHAPSDHQGEELERGGADEARQLGGPQDDAEATTENAAADASDEGTARYATGGVAASLVHPWFSICYRILGPARRSD